MRELLYGVSKWFNYFRRKVINGDEIEGYYHHGLRSDSYGESVLPTWPHPSCSVIRIKRKTNTGERSNTFKETLGCRRVGANYSLY